jgi:hypothetical protein
MDSNETNKEDLAEQLTQANERIARMSQEAEDLKLDRRLMERLTAAGAVDLEAALLLAKARTSGADDVDRTIERLKAEKRYLFAEGPAEKPAPRRTAGAKDRTGSRSGLLEQAARKAAQTGKRSDLQEYLRLRRHARP